MTEYVTDTHGLIWHLTADDRLSEPCRRVFQAADHGEARVWIPGIVLVETVYLVEKTRVPAGLLTRMLDLVDPPTVGYATATLDVAVVRALAGIDRASLPDLPDRVVAATALSRRLPLLSKDRKMVNVIGLTLLW